jgi:hypothetical protein
MTINEEVEEAAKTIILKHKMETTKDNINMVISILCTGCIIGLDRARSVGNHVSTKGSVNVLDEVANAILFEA